MKKGEIVIDLRSDTAARPNREMLAAMARAETGRYLPEEDVESAALEAEAALRLGHDTALFMPTATMANLAALLVHTRSGDTVVVPRDAHVLVAEAGGLTAIAGVLPFVSEVGDASSLLTLFEHHASSLGQAPALAWLENTHTRSGGSVSDVAQVGACVAAAHAAGARVHVDGARLPNAAAALGVDWRDLAAPADSVTLSLNKGLGAPVGALLAGSASFVREALVQRERLGGAWRKPGHLAAAGRLALRTAAASFTRDHVAAARIAEALAAVPGCIVQPPETNIVHGCFVDSERLDRFVAGLGRRQILANVRRPVTVRLVTHSALGKSEVIRVIAAIKDFAGGSPGGVPPANALPAGAR